MDVSVHLKKSKGKTMSHPAVECKSSCLDLEISATRRPEVEKRRRPQVPHPWLGPLALPQPGAPQCTKLTLILAIKPCTK